MTNKKRPQLFWKLDDYKKHGVEPPEELLENSDSTEGYLMDDEKVKTWLSDCLKTFVVLKDEEKDLNKELEDSFIEDMEYLKSIGSLDEETIERVKEEI